jgi:putative serine/threonine protein kinase
MTLPQQSTSFSSKPGYQEAPRADELDLDSPELANILTYPRFTPEDYQARKREAESLGITSVIPGGRTTIGGLKIAGKGCVGIVVKAKVNGKIYALKVRRTDADRKTMLQEFELHKLANQAGVGPMLVDCSPNFIVMEFVDGQSIIDWARRKNDNIGLTEEQTRNLVISILMQCHKMDRAGLDHGELSRLNHHVVISNDTSAFIIDFESASTKRKTCNVTAAAQSMLLSGSLAVYIRKMLGIDSSGRDCETSYKETMVRMLKEYKQEQTSARFHRILDLI